MRRLLAAAALALSLGCLDGATGSDLSPVWLPSTYQLEAVDGSPLPVTLTTADGQSHTIQEDSLRLTTSFTFFHERQITDASGARSITDDGPFTVSREGRIVIQEPGQMLTGAGSPTGPANAIADMIEFRTTAEAAYGEHRYRFVRTVP